MRAEASPNIAFIKYWGKLETTSDADRNLATNPSLSLTLSKARTLTSVESSSGPGKIEDSVFFLNGKESSPQDRLKVQAHLKRVLDHVGASPRSFTVKSENNFPAGAGIASSASAFTALTLATLGEVLGRNEATAYLTTRRDEFSALARRGSGSACRSVSGPFMKWEGTRAQTIGSDWKLFDTILILSKAHKAVPSSDGHRLAQSSPLFPARLAAIPERLKQVESAIATRNIHKLGTVLETEALELHRIVESGREKVEYLTPETRRILKALQSLSSRDFYFTLDAGPNVHLISERPIQNEAAQLLSTLGIAADIWEDGTGYGPCLLD